jgi:VanZ family protein
MAKPLTRLAWGVAVATGALNAAASYGELYRAGRFDLVVHAVTAAALTLLLAAHMRSVLPGVWRPASYIAVLVALGIALGAAWEAAEWVYDHLTGANTIRGKTDSMTDLIADAVGAMVAAILALRIEQRHTKS